MKAWGGRFSEAPDALAAEYGRSIDVDRELALSTGLNVHLVQVLNVCLLGLLGHLLMGALAARRTST